MKRGDSFMAKLPPLYKKHLYVVLDAQSDANGGTLLQTVWLSSKKRSDVSVGRESHSWLQKTSWVDFKSPRKFLIDDDGVLSEVNGKAPCPVKGGWIPKEHRPELVKRILSEGVNSPYVPPVFKDVFQEILAKIREEEAVCNGC